MQNKPSHNLLEVGVNPDKKKNQNQYLFCDNVVLLSKFEKKKNNCKCIKRSSSLLLKVLFSLTIGLAAREQ